jgi:hypothetical protein
MVKGRTRTRTSSSTEIWEPILSDVTTRSGRRCSSETPKTQVGREMTTEGATVIGTAFYALLHRGGTTPNGMFMTLLNGDKLYAVGWNHRTNQFEEDDSFFEYLLGENSSTSLGEMHESTARELTQSVGGKLGDAPKTAEL